MFIYSIYKPAHMNDQDRSIVAKTVGDICGSLTCISVCFGVFAITLSFTLMYYSVDVSTALSIMVGIALGCLFTRISLLLSHCRDCTPNYIFAPVIKWMAVCCILGLVTGAVLSLSYNQKYPNEMCWNTVAGLEENATEYMQQQCPKYRHGVQQLLDYTLIVFPVLLVIVATVQGWYKFSHSHGSWTNSGSRTPSC